MSQPMVTVAVKLQTERTPCGDPKVAETEDLVDKVEVIMEAFAGIIAKGCLASLLVIPGFITGARFHGRKDMHKTRMRPTLFHNSLDTGLFTKLLELADELNLNALLFGNTFSILPELFPKTLRELGIGEYLDALRIKKGTHPLVITPSRQGTLDNNSIVA
jgi:hypothetical protein